MINIPNIFALKKNVLTILVNFNKKGIRGISTINKLNRSNNASKTLFKTSHKNFSDYTPFTLPKKDLYKTLGINQTSDVKEIKQAYYKKAKEYHPDKFVGKII